MKWLSKILKALIVLYLIMCIGLFFAQEKLLFLPHKLDSNHKFRKGIEMKIQVDDAVELSCLRIESKPAKGAILYLHGNKGNIRRCISQSGNFQNLNYDVYIPDYRGFGKSGGKLYSEKQMNNDAELVLKELLKKFKPEQIIVIGYSMGTGMASYLATKYRFKGLLMIAPFKSLVAMKNKYFPIAPPLIMKYKFRTDKNLENIDCPVLIFHGTNDELIPISDSEELKEDFPDKIKFFKLEGDTHRGCIFDNKIRTELQRFIQST